MSKVKRLSHIGISLVLIFNFVILNLGGIIFSRKTARAISVSERTAPRPGEEVGWWVARHKIILFNNTVAFADGDTYEDEVFTSVRAFNDAGSYSGDYDEDLNGGISMKKSRDVEVYKGTNNPSCTLTVNFPYTATTAPASGTLSSTCPNVDKSVKLEKRANGIIDGSYAESNNDEAIEMPIIVQHLSGCGVTGGTARVGADNSDGYLREKTFDKDSGTSGNGQSYDYEGNSDHTGIDILGSQSGDGPFRARQLSWCPDDNSGRSDYGDEPGTPYSGSDGRDIYISKESYEDTRDDIASEIQEFLTQKQQQGEFFNFLTGDNLNKAKFCYAASFETLISDGAIKQLAINTLIGPIPGPFFECLHDIFADDPEFIRIDNIQARSTADPPNPNSGDDNDCGGGIPIISDLVCNLVKWTFDTIFELFTSVIDFFTNPPAILTDQGTGDQLTKIWAVLRNLANIIFILAFLMVVFQYITNYNVVDAYFIKKFIPRLVIAVVLVQASGWITKELMFFFDDLGSSIQAILFSAADITRNNGFEIGGGAATVALFAGPALIGILLPIGLIMLIVLIITIIVLAVRYVAIIVLAIFAPLAFACLAIPQLEGTFKKWLKTYVTLLAMYPIIMLFFSASSIVSSVLNDGGTLLQILALIVQFMPFIVLPFTFKMAGGIMGTVSGKLTDWSKKGAKAGWNASGTKADLDKYKGLRKQNKDNKSDERVARRLKNMQSGDTRRGRLARRSLLRGVDDDKLGTYAGGFEDRVNKRKGDEAKAALDAQLKTMPDRKAAVDHLKSTYDHAMATGDTHTADAAYAGLVGQQAEEELRSIQEAAHAGSIDTAAYNRQQGANYGDLKAFAPHLTGDVGGRVDLDAQRASNLAALSNEQLATAKPEALAAWTRIDPAAAAKRVAEVRAAGGGPAGKLSPDALATILSTAAQSSSAGDLDSALGEHGGIGSVGPDDLKRAYESITKKISKPDHGLGASELANAQSAASRILNELSGRP